MEISFARITNALHTAACSAPSLNFAPCASRNSIALRLGLRPLTTFPCLAAMSSNAFSHRSMNGWSLVHYSQCDKSQNTLSRFNYLCRPLTHSAKGCHRRRVTQSFHKSGIVHCEFNTSALGPMNQLFGAMPASNSSSSIRRRANFGEFCSIPGVHHAVSSPAAECGTTQNLFIYLPGYPESFV